jgi:hypothetical protein
VTERTKVKYQSTSAKQKGRRLAHRLWVFSSRPATPQGKSFLGESSKRFTPKSTFWESCTHATMGYGRTITMGWSISNRWWLMEILQR